MMNFDDHPFQQKMLDRMRENLNVAIDAKSKQRLTFDDHAAVTQALADLDVVLKHIGNGY